MIQQTLRVSLLFIFFVISTLSHAEISDTTANKLLDLSGVTKQAGQFPDLIKAGLLQAGQKGSAIPEGELKGLVNSIDESFAPAMMIEQVRQSLKQLITEEESKTLFAWYNSDLGKKITRAEEDATTPEAYQQMMQSAQSLLANTERVEFAQRLDALLGATDSSMALHEYSSIAVYSAIFAAMRPDTPVDIAPIKSQIQATSTQTRQQLSQLVTISFVYTYQKIESSQLKQYETYLNGATAKKFNKLIMNAMVTGFEQAVTKWAKSIGPIFKPKRQRS